MSHIVVGIQPFDAKQSIAVYVDGICIRVILAEFNDLAEQIYALSKQYKIYNIDLRGQEQFCLKLKQDLLVPRYNKDNLFNITLY